MSEESAEVLTKAPPRFWRWVVGTVSILLIWQGLGLALTIGAARFFDFDLEIIFSTKDADLAKLRELPPWSVATVVLISFVPFFFATVLAYRYILKRPVRALFTAFERYSWRKTWIGFAAFSLISLIFGIGDMIFNHDDYLWSWNGAAFLPFLLVTLTLLPIQTTSEELFFRGWLQQWLDNGKRKRWIISTASGALFALPHMANPEVAGNELFFPIISYGSVGFMLAWVTHRDKTLEIAIGAHFANNILSTLLVSPANSALPSVSLFTTPEVAWVPAAISSVVIVPIFIWLTGKWSPKTTL
jgi:membrane protease YdiL (CAAX protease family)